jgi:hypothetical protein
MRISTNQVSSVVLRPKKLEIRKIVRTIKEPKKNKYCAMKLSQIRRRIELWRGASNGICSNVTEYSSAIEYSAETKHRTYKILLHNIYVFDIIR